MVWALQLQLFPTADHGERESPGYRRIDPPPWGPPVNMDGREAGGCGARVHPVLAAAAGEAGGLARCGHGGSGLVVPLGLPLPAGAWSFPTTISSTETPFKTRRRSPGSQVVTLGTASPRGWEEPGSDLWQDGGQWSRGSQHTGRAAVLCLGVHS